MNDISIDLQKLIDDSILETYLKAQEIYKKTFELPKIVFVDMGVIAGRANSSNNTIELSPTLLKENTESFINQTIPHEIAHIITTKVYGWRASAHGREWKSVMVRLGKRPDRCHKYDTTSVQKVNKPYRYKCSCQVHMVSHTVHGRMGEQVYTCRKCKTPLKFYPNI